jgi:hypothetical protein
MYDVALSDTLVQFVLCLEHSRGLCYSVQQLYYLTCGDEQLVYRVQVFSDETHRQPKISAQVSNEGGYAHTYSALTNHLSAQIY